MSDESAQSAQSRKNPRKRDRLGRLHAVLDAITDGIYDEQLPEIRAVVEERTRQRQEVVLELVAEVFGPNAEVKVGRTPESRRFSPATPDRDSASGAAQESPPAQESLTEDTGSVTSDVNQREREMEAEIESRSPIIGAPGDIPEIESK